VNRRAMTLLETLLASALAAMLLVVMLQMLAGTSSADREMLRRDAPSQVVAWDLIESDLAGSVQRRFEAGVLTLTTTSVRRSPQARVEHVPGEATYAIETIGTSQQLVRRIKSKVADHDQSGDVNLLAANVLSLVVVPAPPEDRPPTWEAPPAWSGSGPQWVMVEITFADGEQQQRRVRTW
jgi:hypothetical protein